MTPRMDSAIQRTVVVAENDAVVARAARRCLEAVGLRVLQASDADGVLGFLRTERPPVALLVADLGLRGMPGLSLVERARVIHPDLRVILISSSFPPVELPEDCCFLGKPFTDDELLACVKKAFPEAQ